jgi:hypothetical protein
MEECRIMNRKVRLLSLYERKRDIVSDMDGFQIAKEIERLVFDILTDIFKPYAIRRFHTEEPGQVVPDIELQVPALGKIKNCVFFEIKSSDLAEFEIMQIEKMIRYLKVAYPRRFHSLVVIARSFGNVERIKELCDLVYPDVMEFMSARTLVEISDFLEKEPEFEDIELRNNFLRDFLRQRGILSLKEIFKERINNLNHQISSLPKLIESAEETLAYWKEQCSRSVRKRELAQRLKRLELELLWSTIKEKRQEIDELEQLINGIRRIRSNIHDVISRIETRANGDTDLACSLERLKAEEVSLAQLETRMRMELEHRSKVLNFERERALKLGPEIEVTEPSADLANEIQEISSRLNELADVSDDVERMYSSYSTLFQELKGKTTKMEAEKMKLLNLQQKLKQAIEETM